jgi:hypothetical protein
MAEIDDLNAWINTQDKQAASTANVGFAAVDQTPDEAAKDYNTAHEFAKVTGNPVPPMPLVKDNRSDFQKAIDEHNRFNVLAASPRLTSWLTNPDNTDVASITKDDLAGLSFWDKLGQNSVETAKAIPGGVVSGTGNALEGVGRLFSPDAPAPAGPVFDDARFGPQDVIIPKGDRLPAMPNADIAKGGRIGQGAVKGGRIDEHTGDDILQRAWDWWLSTRAEAQANSDKLPAAMIDAGKELTEYGNATLPAAPGFEDSWGRAIGHTLGAIVPLIAAGWATGGTGALATGIAQTAGQGAEDARAHGADEQTQNEAALYNAPFGALDLAPVMRLLKAPAAKEGVLHIARSVAEQFALQAGTGAIQTVAANEVAKQLYDPNRGAVDGVMDSAATGGAVGVITDLVRLGLGAIARRRVAGAQARAQAATDAHKTIGELSAQAASSATRTRSPDVFRDIVGHALDGSPREHVFIPADKFVEYFQGLGADPRAIADALPGVSGDDLDTAYASGGDLRIPTSTYAADLAGTEHDAYLMDNMRFDPNDMTFAEARDFNERADDLREEAFEEAENQRLEDEAQRSTEQVIYEEMVSRLRQAGRSNDVATTEAQLYRDFYAAQAAHNGITTEEMLQRYPLPQVAGSIPEGMQLKNVDDLNRTLAEARNRKEVKDNRVSLLEFIDQHGGIEDRGGDLKAMDATVIRRGKGKKTLKIARKFEKGTADMLGAKPADGKKYGPDDVAQAAIEAGYLHDDPIANEWRAAVQEGREVPDITRALYDAIGRETRGEPQYAEERGEAAEQNARIDEIEAYLSGLGVSLNDSDATIRQALEGARQYAQAAWSDRIRGLIDFAKSSVRGVSKKEIIAPVSDRIAAVLKLAGIDVAGYSHDIDADAIRHMMKNHGDEAKEAARGQLPLTDEDIAAIPSVLASADYLVTGFQGKRGQEQVGYIKKMPDGTTLYIEEQRTGRKTLSAVTMRKFPAASDSLSIAKTIDPNARSDGGKLTITRLPPNASDRLLFQRNEAGPRGSIQFPAAGVGRGESIIRLFQNADLSTVVHESGHYFLTVMQDMAAQGASADFDTIKGWWKENAQAVAADGKRVMPDVDVTEADVLAALERGTTGDMMKDAAVDVGMQEQFARGFEAYLMDGKAPSLDLRSAFEKFRSWLISIYKNVAGLNVKLSPEISQVFDRMLASDAAINEAKANAGETGPVFATAEQMGLTQQQYDRFMQVRAQAQDEAKARLLREAMAPVKREQQKAYREEKKNVRAEVEKEINGYRAYRAIEWMANKRVLGENAPEVVDDIRFDKAALVSRYGPGVLETLPRGKQKVYVEEGGHDPDDIAGLFGFDSGDDMVRAMEQAPPRKEAIDAETDLRMRQKHGDVLNDGSLEAEALSAVHNDKKAEWLATELKAVTEASGVGVAITAKQAGASAKAATGRMRVRDAADSRRYLAAERKAGAEAARLGAQLAREKIWLDQAKRKIEVTARAASKGNATSEQVAGAIDAHNAKFETTQSTYVSGKTGNEVTTTSKGYNDLVAAFVDAKRRQLLNHALYSESIKIAKEVEGAERYVKRLGKASTQRKIAGAGRRENAQVDYLSAINELLDRYDFRHMSQTAEARRGALNDFVARMVAAGRENELAIPDAVMAQAARAPYKTVPVEELRGVIDSLKNIEHVALRWNDAIDARNERNFEKTVEGMKEGIKENLPDNPPDRLKSGFSVKKAGKQFLNLILNATTILRDLDGGKDQGAVHEAIKAPLDRAAVENVERQEKSRAAVEGLFNAYSASERRAMARRSKDPVLGLNISKWEKLAIALNTGNEGNMHRLTDPKLRQTGGSFTPEQVKYVLDSLDARDAKFVQSVWDHLETYRKEIGERERRVTGVEPKWVDASPVTIGGREMRGGYYPLKYDAEFSALTADLEDQDLQQSLQGGRFGKAQTRNGHTKARAGSSGQAIDLDIGVLARHITNVNYDLSYSEVLSNSWRFLQAVRGDLTRVGRSADFDTLQAWLLDVGTGEIRSGDVLSVLSRVAKNNFTVSKLAFNVATALGQVAGFAQSIAVVGAKDYSVGTMQSFRPGIREQIAGKSTYMAKRQGLFHKDINDYFEASHYGAVASRWKDFKSVLGKVGFWLMEKIQYHVVDVPTWLAGYNQGLRKFGGDEARAIAHADDVVKRAQSSGLFQDRSAIERGTLTKNHKQLAFVKLFTALGSYMFTKGNIAYEKARQTGRNIQADGGGALAYARHSVSLAVDMVMLFTVDAVVMSAIRGTAPSLFGGSGSPEDDKKDGWAKFLAKQTGYSVMGALPIVRDMASVFEGFDGGGAYGSVVGDAGKGLLGAYNVLSSPVTGDEVKNSDITAIINGTGLATGLPTGQVARTVGAGLKQMGGQDTSLIEYVLGKRR